MTPDRPLSLHHPGADALLEAVAGNPIAMVNVARTLLMANGQVERAREVCREAIALAPGDAEALALARPILSHGIGSWYFTMVLDDPRHALYERALRRVLQNGGLVLDIGAGTGLFAMLAVRAGASHVIACERDPEVARAAQQAINRNGFANCITLLPIDSRELVLGRDMPRRADVLLWDNLANNFLGAGCAATLADAKARLVAPDAPTLPSRAELLAAPVTDLEASARSMGLVDGIDMSDFNVLRTSDFTLSASKLERRGEAVRLFDFDVSGNERIQAGRASACTVLTAGRVDGIAQWLRFHLAEDISYETWGDEVRAFGAQFHVTEAFGASEGTSVTLHGAHDTLDTWFWIER